MTISHGVVEPGFEAVRSAFEENFTKRGDEGAAACAYVDGRRVVDLWGGEARPGVRWSRDTLVGVFSTTKGPTALTLAALAEAGAIDVTRTVSDYWPGFAVNGKSGITIEHLLTHRSGVIDFPGYASVVGDPSWWLDLDSVAASFETAEPAWEPGTSHGYHGASMGLILGEVVRRATGRTLGANFRSLVADPLGADVWIGLPPEHGDRVAFLRDAPEVTDPTVAAYLSLFTPETLTGRAHLVGETGISALADGFNRKEIWSFEFPSGGGIASAQGLAAMYDALARGGRRNGSRIVSESTLGEFTRERVRGPDLVLLWETRFGLGFMRPTSFVSFGGTDESFGHGGLGGSLAFADPVNRVSFAYVMNQIIFPNATGTTRASALTNALYNCLDQ